MLTYIHPEQGKSYWSGYVNGMVMLMIKVQK